MTSRESFITVVDLLLWTGAGAAMLLFATLFVLAVFRGYVSINGQKATKHEEPAGYLLALAAYCGVIYFLWPSFLQGLSAWWP